VCLQVHVHTGRTPTPRRTPTPTTHARTLDTHAFNPLKPTQGASSLSARRLVLVTPSLASSARHAGDHARSKLFVLPIPDTPDESTTHPSLPPKYFTPQPLTHNGAVSALQILSNNRLLFSRSSLQGPNDLFIIHGLHELEADFVKTQGDFKWEGTPEQITRFTEKALVGKTLRPPEDFYFEGQKGGRFTVMLLSRTGGRKSTRKSGRDYFSFMLKRFTGPQGRSLG
jgi:hypothetical protein